MYSRIAAVGSVDHQPQPRPRLRQPLPGITGQLALFFGGELIGEAADHAGGTQPLSSGHDGSRTRHWSEPPPGKRAFPAFSARFTTAVNSSRSYFSKTSELSTRSMPLKEVLTVIDARGHHHHIALVVSVSRAPSSGRRDSADRAPPPGCCPDARPSLRRFSSASPATRNCSNSDPPLACCSGIHAFRDGEHREEYRAEADTPAMVASCLVKKFTMAVAKSINEISAKPTGTSTPRIWMLPGTFHSRFSGACNETPAPPAT